VSFVSQARRCLCFFSILLLWPVSLVYPQNSAALSLTEPARARGLDLTRRQWTGDFDHMLERRIIRVLVPYSRTLYFNDRGRQRGITAEFVRDFERYLNEKYAKQLRNRPLTVAMIPGTRDRLFEEVASAWVI
jgi:hypothetical protein